MIRAIAEYLLTDERNEEPLERINQLNTRTRKHLRNKIRISQINVNHSIDLINYYFSFNNKTEFTK